MITYILKAFYFVLICSMIFMFVKFECFHCVNYIQTHVLDVLYLFCSKLVFILHQPCPWPFKTNLNHNRWYTHTSVCMVHLSLWRIVEQELICIYVCYIFKLPTEAYTSTISLPTNRLTDSLTFRNLAKEENSYSCKTLKRSQITIWIMSSWRVMWTLDSGKGRRARTFWLSHSDGRLEIVE